MPGEVREANKPLARGPRSGRAVRYSKPPLGRAEQRSSVRIKTLALFERSEFASVPNAASSARDRVSGTDVARLFFGYFLLAKQKKVTRLPGRNPASHRRKTQPANQTPSLLTKARHAVPLRPPPSLLAQGTARRAPTPSPLPPRPGHGTPCPYTLTPPSSPRARHAVPLRPPPSLLAQGTARRATTPSPLTPRPGHGTPCPYTLTPHSYDLTPHSSFLIPTTSPLQPNS